MVLWNHGFHTWYGLRNDSGRGIRDGIDVPIVCGVSSQMEIRGSRLLSSHRRCHKVAPDHVTHPGIYVMGRLTAQRKAVLLSLSHRSALTLEATDEARD